MAVTLLGLRPHVPRAVGGGRGGIVTASVANPMGMIVGFIFNPFGAG